MSIKNVNKKIRENLWAIRVRFFTATDSHKFSRIIIVAPKMVSTLFQRHVVVVVAFVASDVFKHTQEWWKFHRFAFCHVFGFENHQSLAWSFVAVEFEVLAFPYKAASCFLDGLAIWVSLLEQ